MAKKEINFTIDTMQQSYSPIGTFKEFDSVFFNITILENGISKDLTGQALKLYVKRADKTILEQTVDIEIIDATKGTIFINVKNGAFKGDGFSIFELNISDATGSITTANFTCRTIKKIANDDFIESTNEIATLKEIEIYVAQAQKEIQDFKILQTEMLETNSIMDVQENIREEQELKRKENEAIRQQQEANRVENFNQYDQKLIDLENRMAENIAKQYLEVSADTGYMKVDNCYNGRTKDLSIKGKTLQNLFKSDSNIYCNSGHAKSFDHKLIVPSKSYTVIVNIKESNITQRAITFMRFTMNTPLTYVYANKNGTSSFIPTPGIHIFTLSIPSDFIINNSWIFYNNAYIAGEKVVADVMILEGDHTSNPSQYFEGIKSLGEKENKISILSTGKNLCDNSKIKYPLTLDGDTGLEKSGTNNVTDFIPVKYGESYIFSSDGIGRRFNKYLYNSKKEYIGKLIDTEAIITIDKFEYNFIRCTYGNSLENENIQMEAGIRPSKYETYKVDKKDILLPFEAGLKGIESINVYDEYNNDLFTENIGMRILNGIDIEDWRLENQTDNFAAFYLRGFIKTNPECISNRFIYAGGKVGAALLEGVSCDSAYGVLRLSITKSKLESIDVTGLKKWLSKNPTTVYYKLDIPIIHQSTKISLNTYKDITHVSCLNNIVPSNLSAKFPVSLSDTISRLTNENKNLEKENDLFKNNQSFIASVMLNMLSISILPVENENKDLELLKKLEEISKLN